jgi:hypothetical protein
VQKVHFRKLIRVTREAHLSGLVKEIHPPLVLSSNEVVFDNKGMIVAWLMKDIISDKLMDNLEKSANKCTLGQFKEDARGKNKKATLGSMVERGGSGKIHPQQHETKAGKEFLTKNKNMIEYLSQIMTCITPIQSFLVEYVPKEHKVMDKFSVCFWNRTPIGKLAHLLCTLHYHLNISLTTENTHRDSRDWYYCWIVPFGNWTGGEISLKYNNIKVCEV